MLGEPVLRSVAGRSTRRFVGAAGRACTIMPAAQRKFAQAKSGHRDTREESMLERTRVQSPFYTTEHEAFRDVMRRFVAREIEPFAHEWDEAGEFPRELYRRASEIGLLGLGFPEEYGGVPADQFMKIVASQELARAGAGGVSASLMSHTIGSPPIAPAARPQIKALGLPQGLAGEKISPPAITEPRGGYDRPKFPPPARRDG